MTSVASAICESDHLNFWAGPGLDYQRVSDFLTFGKNELSKASGVPVKQVRFDERIPNDLKTHLEQIAATCNLVAEYFDGDRDKTALWFRTENPKLGNLSPRDMIRFGRYERLQKFVLAAREQGGWGIIRIDQWATATHIGF